VALAAGVLLDRRFERYADFPWGRPLAWGKALVKRIGAWWALSPYVLGIGLALVAAGFAGSAGEAAGVYLLLAGVMGWAIYRFRLRIWLLATTVVAHLSAFYLLVALNLWRFQAVGWLRLLPVFLLTLGLALFIERRRHEGAPLRLLGFWHGWSRPLYGLLFLEGALGQLLSLEATTLGVQLTVLHTIGLATLATYWRSSLLAALALPVGALAFLQLRAMDSFSDFVDVALIDMAGLFLAYGLAGYALRWLRLQVGADNGRLFLWEKPLRWVSLLVSVPLLCLTMLLGLALLPIESVIGVLALLGLLYLTASVAHRLQRLGYVALGMLLSAWLLHVHFVLYLERAAPLQWYVLPTGGYLLALGYLEWQRANKTLGRWLDYAAMLLLFGSLFWQTLLFGWLYALMLGAEGLVAFWWGSARRLRRFFYAGLGCVLLATVAQLLNSLQSINQWIVFGIIGLGLVVTGLAVERKLEEIKLWREVLESWE
ncbi:MAG: hypothetical protein H0T73_00825, partial [Ardenticatenales bacterium]|nr:hypothetical protein [Ardenticatenales bacterium]